MATSTGVYRHVPRSVDRRQLKRLLGRTVASGGGGGATPWLYLLPGDFIGSEEEVETMKKNTAGQVTGAQMWTASDGSDFTGTVTVYITGDGGTQTIGSVGSGVCTHKGKGYHTYLPSQAETNYDLVAFTFQGSGALTRTVQERTTTDITAEFVAVNTKLDTIDDLIDTEVGAIKAKTDQLTFTVANQVDANTLTGGGTGLSSDITAIKAKTDNLPSDPADASVVAGLIGGLDTKLDTIDNFIDTEVSAIKAKTDQLTFTVTNQVDATASLPASESSILSSGTATAGGNKTITLQTALGADNLGIGCKIKITSGTGSKQMRRITGYVNSTKVVTVDRAWTTNPDNTSVYSVVYDSDVGPTVCRYGAAFTSSAGTTLKISAWLERDGQAVVLASGSCTVTYRENASGSDLFTITDSAPNAQGIFEMSQTSPGFTSDRLQVASIEITVGNDTWITREPVPVFG